MQADHLHRRRQGALRRACRGPQASIRADPDSRCHPGQRGSPARPGRTDYRRRNRCCRRRPIACPTSGRVDPAVIPVPDVMTEVLRRYTTSDSRSSSRPRVRGATDRGRGRRAGVDRGSRQAARAPRTGPLRMVPAWRTYAQMAARKVYIYRMKRHLRDRPHRLDDLPADSRVEHRLRRTQRGQRHRHRSAPHLPHDRQPAGEIPDRRRGRGHPRTDP